MGCADKTCFLQAWSRIIECDYLLADCSLCSYVHGVAIVLHKPIILVTENADIVIIKNIICMGIKQIYLLMPSYCSSWFHLMIYCIVMVVINQSLELYCNNGLVLSIVNMLELGLHQISQHMNFYYILPKRTVRTY